jgi:hypothetical protein
MESASLPAKLWAIFTLASESLPSMKTTSKAGVVIPFGYPPCSRSASGQQPS